MPAPIELDLPVGPGLSVYGSSLSSALVFSSEATRCILRNQLTPSNTHCRHCVSIHSALMNGP